MLLNFTSLHVHELNPICRSALVVCHQVGKHYTYENKTNHPISSNSHHSTTANIAVHYLKRGGGDTKPTGTSYNLDRVRRHLEKVRSSAPDVHFRK